MLCANKYWLPVLDLANDTILLARVAVIALLNS
jgi:hypothetical protein